MKMKNLLTKIFQRLPQTPLSKLTTLSDDSITKNSHTQPVNDNNQDFGFQKVILSILETTNFIKLCGYLAIFFTLIGVSMQSPYVKDINDLAHIIAETFVSSLFIILSIILFVRWLMQKIENKPYSQSQITQQLILSMVFIIPLTSLMSRLIIFILFGITMTWLQLIVEAIANTLMSLVMIYIVLNYIKHQANILQENELKYNKKLREENEQLKARTSSHFFFNMLNTMQSLVEINPQESTKLLNRIATLYRASFAETKEVSMLEEIEICKDYLSIEHYRFHERLVVTWDIPDDEELLYDMSISSLMLQMTIEKMVLYVVEMTSDTIYLYIQIRWENDWVKIQCVANIPTVSYTNITNELEYHLSYNKQAEVLRNFYGQEAEITSYYTIDKLVTTIHYPLKDLAC